MVFDFPPSGHLNLDDWSGLDQRWISFTDSRAGAVSSIPRAGRGQSAVRLAIHFLVCIENPCRL